MANQHLLQRISSDPEVLAGKAVIRGTRLSVNFIVNLLAHGSSFNDILEEYEGLEEQDIQACLLFAAQPGADAVPTR